MKCGHCKQDHGTLDEVRACAGQPRLPGMPTGKPTTALSAATAGPPITPAQLAYLTKLCAQRPMWADVENLHADILPRLTKAQASSKIQEALTVEPEVVAQRAEATGYAAEAKRGDVHYIGGTYYRIHISQKSGNAYAAKAIITKAAKWNLDGSLDEPGTILWEYQRGLISNLTKDTLTTAEQAAAFGNLVGRCCFCSHAIDTPESTAVGYGPICAGKYDLPWGDTTQEVSPIVEAK